MKLDGKVLLIFRAGQVDQQLVLARVYRVDTVRDLALLALADATGINYATPERAAKGAEFRAVLEGGSLALPWARTPNSSRRCRR